jgi:hypothetical protein
MRARFSSAERDPVTSADRIEGYLVKLALSFQKPAPGTWVVSDSELGLENLAIFLSEPLVVMRTQVMEVPSSGKDALFEKLLRFNATDMVHGAYAVDGTHIIIIDTLEADTMDIEEFKASIDAIGLALAQHYRPLSKYRHKA